MFFMAHDGRDTERATELRNLLHPDVSVFLDTCDLVPGDEWDVELPRHQRQARATVALLSASTEAAYYLRGEIAAAIAYQRDKPDTHRLIPVYLDGVPKQIPYGMRVRHALDAARLGMVGVAAELKKVATALTIAPSPSLPPDMPEPADRIATFEALCTFLPPQFDEIVLRVNAPKQHLAPTSEPLARRVLDLVQWAEQGGPTRMNGLCGAIQKALDRAQQPAGVAGKLSETHIGPKTFILPPVDTEGFAGRKTELQRLTELLINGSPPAGGRVVGVFGPPGVGKSGLAVHFAKTERERFPGGVLGVDLRGVEDPADAISRFATAQGEPLTSEEQVRPLHEIMQVRFADRRCLLVLDNLEHGSALKRIKPGGQAAVLITCRNQEVLAQFAVPAANRIPLGALLPDDARQYLEIAFGHGTHSAVELDSLAHHVRYLPLALRIAARRLLEDPLEQGRIGRFLQRLRDADDPLGELVVDGEADLDLIRLFALSLEHLPEPSRRAFACLSACAPHDFGAQAAAAATGFTNPASLLARLTRLSLLEINQVTARYRFHPLIDDYARRLADRWSLAADARQRHGQAMSALLRNSADGEGEALLKLLEEQADILHAINYMVGHGRIDLPFLQGLNRLVEQAPLGRWHQEILERARARLDPASLGSMPSYCCNRANGLFLSANSVRRARH